MTALRRRWWCWDCDGFIAFPSSTLHLRFLLIIIILLLFDDDTGRLIIQQQKQRYLTAVIASDDASPPRPLLQRLHGERKDVISLSPAPNDREKEQRNRRVKQQQQQSFEDWVNRTHANYGVFLSKEQLATGDVLLFRAAKKSRHRAVSIPVVMRMAQHSATTLNHHPHYHPRKWGKHQQRLSGMDQPQSELFQDFLTFKDWLRKMYSQQDKAIKVSVRTTEVVRPVLQHLYASKAHFHAPLIVHANIFEGKHPARERTVDAIIFVENMRQLLPEAAISIGWTPSEDFTAINSLDWPKSFQLIGLLHAVRQPVILNMRLNDAAHSLDQLEFLLGVDQPAIYLVLKGDFTDLVPNDLTLRRLAAMDVEVGHTGRVLFDLDNEWRTRLSRLRLQQRPLAASAAAKKEKRSVEPALWRNLDFGSNYQRPSTAVISSEGVAMIGWPSSLVISNRERSDLPSKSTLKGKIMFLPRRRRKANSENDETSGLQIQLFSDFDIDLLDSTEIRNAIRLVIGHDGQVHIENNSKLSRKEVGFYSKSSSARLPENSCYGFELNDRGWRVEIEVWTERCFDERPKNVSAESRTYLHLNTPIARSRKTRNVAVGKVGDAATDFLLRKLEHNSAIGHTGFSAAALLPISLALIHFVRILLSQPSIAPPYL